MMAQDRAAAPDAETGRVEQQSRRYDASAGAMSLQSGRGYDAAPQAFVRLTGSHLVSPQASRATVTA
ncbi:hypothetical protein JJB99_21425 [Bradyrhizobium diazoefficiens]|uniref:hypothetical protein n=1 Tax=Bradyrhizobium diazoefficiens TaxID=1355477 RepID=UPI00190A0039|nr:hypothetical protein [Bradyrhizobium diazoefficiens]QQO12053.1 hypothetical protein JJB99_21425 [Bradyrhizobium diazoefficiens]